jgi:hypothetical protein
MEAPASDGNGLSPVPPQEQPKTSIPKVIGILNIIFGSLLMLCTICSGLNLMMQSTLAGPMMAMQQQQVQQAMQVERQQRIQELEEREKAAKDEKEKAELKAKQKAIQAQPAPKMPDFNRFLRDPTFQGFAIVDMASAFVLNILMVISGIALLRLKEWGRATAIWVAAVKIVRLVGLYTYEALVVVPVMVKGFNDMFQEMLDEMARAAPPGQRMPAAGEMAQLGTVMGVMMTASIIGMVIFGVIYPIIVLIALTRARVKAACAPPPAKTG